MRTLLTGAIVLGLGLAAFFAYGNRAATEAAADANDKMIAHMVYFSLKDNSAAAKKKLVAACNKYLSKHPGEVFYAAGLLAEEFNRPVNDRDFDVALHIVFKDKAAHDKYQDAPRHNQFIDENKDSWKKVRVFDSVVGR